MSKRSADRDNKNAENTLSVVKKKQRKTKAKKEIIVADPSAIVLATEVPRLLVNAEDRFHGKVTFNYKADIAVFLRRYLPEGIIDKFRDTVFGHFLDVGVVTGQAQVVHGLMLREVACGEAETMKFWIGQTTLTFGLQEFGLISGLKMHGDLKTPDFEEKDHRLMRSYFNDDVAVKKASLLDLLQYQRWNDDEDAVKLAIVAVIHTYIMSSRPDNHITRNDFAMVESGKYAQYPWARASFRMLSASLKGRLSNRQPESGVVKSFHYKVDGCPVVFQCWFYECCDRMNGIYASRRRTGQPRICNWDSQGPAKVQLDAISKTIFDSIELRVANIVPTREELGEESSGIGIGQDHLEAGMEPEVETRGMENSLEARLEALENNHRTLSEGLVDLRQFVDKSLRSVMEKIEELEADVRGFREGEKVTNSSPVGTGDGLNEGNKEHMNENAPSNVPSFELSLLADEAEISFEDVGRIAAEVVSGSSDVNEDVNIVADEAAMSRGKELGVEASTVNPEEQIVESDGEVGAVEVLKNSFGEKRALEGLFLINYKKGKSRAVAKKSVKDDMSRFKIVERTKSVLTPIVEETTSGDFEGEGVEKDKKKLNDKGKNKVEEGGKEEVCLNYAFKHIFGSLGSFVGMKGEKKVIRAAFPINYEQDMTVVTTMSMLEGLSALIGEDEVGKDGKDTSLSQLADVIKEPFDFVVAAINSRKWFRELTYVGNFLEDTHINIYFYYLRKMLKYGNVGKNLTTTDDLFDQTLSGLLDAYNDPKLKNKKSLFTDGSIVSEYILGKMLQAGKPWSSIDEVLFPVNTDEHWILVRLDIKSRMLVVYDSIRNEGHDEHVSKILRRYSVILPFYMISLGIWSDRKEKGGKTKTSKPQPIKIKWQDGLPLQSLPDCGAYTMAFAEYYALDKLGLMNAEFSIEQFREKTACLLFHYGRMKNEDGCISDDESPRT